MLKTLFTLLCTLVMVAAIGQSAIQPAQLVQHSKQKGEQFQTSQLFNIYEGRISLGEEAPLEYDLYELDRQALQQAISEKPSTMNFALPTANRGLVEVELVRVDLFSDEFAVIESHTNAPAKVERGVHYRGLIKGQPNSIAALSIFDNDVMGMFSSNQGNFVMGKLQGNRHQDKFIFYRDQDILSNLPLDCSMPDDGKPYSSADLAPNPGNRALSDCVQLYFETDYDIYQDKGSTQNVTNFVTGLYNQVATLYANESINTEISDIFVWTSSSPYSSSSSSGMLSDFQNYRNSWNGDLAQLLSYQASGGIAAGFSGLCNSNRDNSMSFSNIQSTYSTVPTYSWSVMVVTHEFGHLWGSRHTHACVWNGNNTAIDGCAGQTEGSCSLPGYPSGGGTIMSYCHLQSVGINFNNGFGTQPGNVIRNRTSNASCLQSCGGPTPTCSDGIQNGDETGVDCGGSSCPPCSGGCTENSVTLTIVLDNYPEETSWTVTNSSGGTVASGGTYGNRPDGSTVVENLCLADGCYDFNIFDSYGDGICCSYGSGSYSLTAGSTVLASGGNFGSSETTNFCLGSGPPPSYCESQGNNSSYEWIQRFQFAGINNTSGNNGGYADFTNISTSLTAGGTASVTLVPGFSSSTYTEYWNIWIDYNQDGDFDDSGELVGQGSGTGTLSGTLNISSSALSGSTRLRVAMKYNAYSTPCETFTYGEVEDYTVVIGGSLIAGAPPTALNATGLASINDQNAYRSALQVYPNPAQEHLNLDFNARTDGEVSIEIINLMGQQVKWINTEAYQGDNAYRIQIDGLPDGAYLIRLKAGEDQFTEKLTIAR
jgi:hypothetical protein